MTYISKQDQQIGYFYKFLIVIPKACHRIGFFLWNQTKQRSGWIPVAPAANWKSVYGADAHSSSW